MALKLVLWHAVLRQVLKLRHAVLRPVLKLRRAVLRRHSPVALRQHSPVPLRPDRRLVVLKRHSPVALKLVLRHAVLRPDREEDNPPRYGSKTSLTRRNGKIESEKTPGSRKGPGVFCLTFLQT